MKDKARIAGVGMVPFTKAGRSPAVRRDGGRCRAPGAGRCGHRLRAGAAGLRRLRDRRHHLGPAGAVSGGADRHPDRQRQQRLLERIDRAVPGAPGGRKRQRRRGARGRLRADAGRRAGVAVQRPAERQRHAQRDGRAARSGWDEKAPIAAQYFGGAGARVPAALRHRRRDLREDLGQVAPARVAQPAGGVPRADHGRRGARVAARLRHADPAAMLPADLRRRGGARRLGRLRAQPRPAAQRRRSPARR